MQRHLLAVKEAVFVWNRAHASTLPRETLINMAAPMSRMQTTTALGNVASIQVSGKALNTERVLKYYREEQLDRYAVLQERVGK
jgi:hypothetical protein